MLLLSVPSLPSLPAGSTFPALLISGNKDLCRGSGSGFGR